MDIYEIMELLGAVFLRLVNISIAAGVMILAVALIRRVFPKMPKWLCCLLWALPALRLLLPVSIPNPFSLAPNTETVYEVRTAVPDAGGVSVPVLNSGIEAVDNAVNPALERTFVAATQSAAAVTGTVRDFDPSDWFGLLWAAGCAVMLAYLLVSFLRFRRKVQPCVPYEKGVYLTDGVSAPFILGVLRPRVYLPSALPEVHYPAILAHERAHLKRKDHWWKPLGFLLLAVHWFNPLVWLGYRLLCRDIEFACDEKVIRDADPAAKKAYAEALLTCGAPLKGTAACPLAFGEVGVKARIKRVLRYKKPAVWIAAVALLAASVAAFFFLTDRPFQWEHEWFSEFETGRVYLDSVVSPQKASRESPRTVILDEENHLVIRYANGAAYDYGPADISGEYLWDYVKDYVPAQYRNSRPSKSPEAVSIDPYRGSGYARHFVIFRPRGNVFFFAVIAQTPEGYSAESVCRLTRKGNYVRVERSPRWYLTVPVENAASVVVSGGGLGRGVTRCSHLTFTPGERVWLKCLEGRDSVDGLGLTFTLYDVYGQPLTGSTADGTSIQSEYGEGVTFSVSRMGQALHNGNADPRDMAAEFLTLWFSPDHNGRYTDTFKRGAEISEQAVRDYLSGIKDYVTDEYYDRIVQNRGYQGYDKMAVEKGWTVTVRSVDLRLNDAGEFDFTVYLYERSNGMGDTAAGTIRFKDGKIDGMLVSDITLGKERRGGGETPTAYFYEEGETARYEEEWSTVAVEQTAVDADLMDCFHITPSLLPLAEQALQPVNRSVGSGGVRVTVTQALHYAPVVGAVVTVEFEQGLLGDHPAGDLRRPDFTLTTDDGSSDGDMVSCVSIRQETERVSYFFRLFRGKGASFTPGTELKLTLKGFSDAQGDFTMTLPQPLSVSWQISRLVETVRTVDFSSDDGLAGTAVLTPLSLQISLSAPFPDTNWTGDVLLRDEGNRPITGLSCQTRVGTADTVFCNVGLTAFFDPNAIGWLWIDGRQMELSSEHKQLP